MKSEVSVAKKLLRQELIQKRNNLSEQTRIMYSQLISHRVFSLVEYQRATVIMLYLNFNSEVETKEIVLQAIAQGKRVVVPVTDTKNHRLIPSELKHYPEDLTTGVWGILEPKPECMRPIAPEEIDLVLLPGVGFDRLGNRLGYGGGYYDRFIPLLPSKVDLVALAFNVQLCEQVYAENHDQVMHLIVTEDETINVG